MEDLVPLESNPRVISDEEFARLKERIEKRGFHDVVKIDTDNVVLSGNMRKRALTELGIPEVNVLVPNRPLTEEERRAVIIESNRSDGRWDYHILGLEYDNNELLGLGFSRGELGLTNDEQNIGLEKDTNRLAHSAESYLDGNIRQIVLYFKPEEFNETIKKLDKVMQEKSLESHTEVFLHLLDFYEGN